MSDKKFLFDLLNLKIELDKKTGTRRSHLQDVLFSTYTPEKIIFNDRTTIVVWKDGTKTIVKCADGETFYEENGFLAALGKKIFGGRNTYLKIVEKAYRQPEKKAKALDKSE